jgi:hypothetical protein
MRALRVCAAGTHSYLELLRRLTRYIRDERVGFVRGFYNMSLTRTLAADEHMRPALFVEIDCDLYISTHQALDWLLQSRLIVPGTLIGYDDWVAGGPGGQARAHDEMSRKWSLRTRRLRDPRTGSQRLNGLAALFEVISVGEATSDGG